MKNEFLKFQIDVILTYTYKFNFFTRSILAPPSQTASGVSEKAFINTMPPEPTGWRGPARKRKREAIVHKCNLQKISRNSNRPAKKKEPKIVSNLELIIETEPQNLLETETTVFLQLLENDVSRLPPPLPLHDKYQETAYFSIWKSLEEFRLPFKKTELQSLEQRQWVRRPPPFGKISRCVYVSSTMPIADFPVHKCTCCEGIYKFTTKRTTMIASVKAQKELEDKDVPDQLGLHRVTDDVVYCGEGCYNRMLFISCSDKTCSAPDPALCSNRAIKRRKLKSMRVEYIVGPGFGLFTNEPIRAGEFVIEYVGEVVDNKECERRMAKYRKNGEVSLALQHPTLSRVFTHFIFTG